jgi:hypothetical protein
VTLLRAGRAARAHVVGRQAQPCAVSGRETRAVAGAEHDVREGNHVLLVPPPASRQQTDSGVPLVVDGGDLHRLADDEGIRRQTHLARDRLGECPELLVVPFGVDGDPGQ